MPKNSISALTHLLKMANGVSSLISVRRMLTQPYLLVLEYDSMTKAILYLATYLPFSSTFVLNMISRIPL